MLWITQRPQCKCSGRCSSKDRLVAWKRQKCISMPSKIMPKWLIIAHWASSDYRKTSSSNNKSFKAILSRTTKQNKMSWDSRIQLSHWPVRGKRWQAAPPSAKISWTVWLRFLTRTMKWNGVRPFATSKNLDREPTTSPITRRSSNSAWSNCPFLQTPLSSRLHSERIYESINQTYALLKWRLIKCKYLLIWWPQQLKRK